MRNHRTCIRKLQNLDRGFDNRGTTIRPKSPVTSPQQDEIKQHAGLTEKYVVYACRKPKPATNIEVNTIKELRK